MMRNFLSVFISGTFALLATSASGQGFPDRPIMLVVPFAAGGGADILGRIVGESLSKEIGQPVIVENKPGAGGNIGMQYAVKSAANGYTLGYGTNGTFSTNHWLYKSTGYSLNDIQPITRLSMIPLALATTSSTSFETAEDLIQYARENQGKLTCGSAGNGTTSHLGCELLKQMANVDVTHVPYKGNAAALIDLLAGRVDFVIDVIPNLSTHVKAQNIKLLAVTTSQRISTHPDVPTLNERAVNGYTLFAWDGIYTQKSTPPDIVKKIHAALMNAMKQPKTYNALVERGAIPSTTSIVDFEKFVSTEYENFGSIVKKSGAAIN